MSIPTRRQAIEDLSMFGIREPQIYLVDILPLIEMIWADGTFIELRRPERMKEND